MQILLSRRTSRKKGEAWEKGGDRRGGGSGEWNCAEESVGSDDVRLDDVRSGGMGYTGRSQMRLARDFFLSNNAQMNIANTSSLQKNSSSYS